ncbi:hypothetical protein TNCV_3974621 [Trichonephila clavipes]|nr:hypothetical protein TNCV_3974621 [Trichonephila clavipes]
MRRSCYSSYKKKCLQTSIAIRWPIENFVVRIGRNLTTVMNRWIQVGYTNALLDLGNLLPLTPERTDMLSRRSCRIVHHCGIPIAQRSGASKDKTGYRNSSRSFFQSSPGSLCNIMMNL